MIIVSMAVVVVFLCTSCYYLGARSETRWWVKHLGMEGRDED